MRLKILLINPWIYDFGESLNFAFYDIEELKKIRLDVKEYNAA